MSIRFGDIEKITSVLFPKESADNGKHDCGPDRASWSAAVTRLAALPREESLPVVHRLLSAPTPDLGVVMSAYSKIDRDGFTQYTLQELAKSDPTSAERILRGLQIAWQIPENRSPLVVQELLDVIQNPESSNLDTCIRLLELVALPPSPRGLGEIVLDDIGLPADEHGKDRNGNPITDAFLSVLEDSCYPWPIRMRILEMETVTPNEALVEELFVEGLRRLLQRVHDNGDTLTIETIKNDLRSRYFKKCVGMLGQMKSQEMSQNGSPRERIFFVIFRSGNLSGRMVNTHRLCVRYHFEGDSKELKVDRSVDLDGNIPRLQSLWLCQDVTVLDASFFAAMTALRYLDIDSFPTQIQALGLALSHCPFIESLNFACSSLDGVVLAKKLGNLQPLLHLTSLTSPNAKLTDHLLPLCPNLKRLSTSFDEGLGSRIASLCPCVTSLHFNQPSLKDEDLDSLLGIQSVTDFGMFCLSQSKIEGTRLATANPNLHRLVLGSCGKNMSLDGMANIAKLYPALRHFQVMGEDLSSEDVEPIFHCECSVSFNGFGDPMTKHWHTW